MSITNDLIEFLISNPGFFLFVTPTIAYLFESRQPDFPVALRAYIQATLLGTAYSTVLIIIGTYGFGLLIFPIIYAVALAPSAAVGLVYGFPLVLILKKLKHGARWLCLLLGPLPGLAILSFTGARPWIGLLAMFNGALVMFAAMNGIRDIQEQARPRTASPINEP